VTEILATKLYIPPIRPESVSRPRLIERLNGDLQHKLTLVSAPAGFGKTTLVSQWVDLLQSNNPPDSQIENKIGWLSLDENDSDPVRFLAYLIAALSRIAEIDAACMEQSAGMLQSPQPPPIEDVLTSLINEFVTIPGRIILVLDDYHIIESPPVDEAVSYLLERLPPQMHLVIATRVDPQLPLARWRAQGQLAELRARDLRFTLTEAAEFLNLVMGLDLSPEDVAALESRTEGWIAGLQLAAISMQGQRNTAGFIQSFTGSHRFVLDYLIEEVLNRQPESVQSFLLHTAILGRLTGSLCDALTGDSNGQATLETLEHANLFIVPLDDERRWYRYHYLFADLLRKRLRQKQPALEPVLHTRAGEWYEDHGFADEAIDHVLHAEDFKRAADLIEATADASWRQGEHAKLRRWLFKLPPDIVIAEPHLCIIHAWYLFASGQYEAAEQNLQAVERALGFNRDPGAEVELQGQVSLAGYDRLELQGRLAAIRAFMDAQQGIVPGMIQHANQALEYLPEQDSTWRSLIAIVLGDVHGFKGDMAAAYKARLAALKACEETGEIYYILLASMKVAITLRSQGKLQRTMEICQKQIQRAQECGLSHTSLIGLLLAIRGEVLAEINDLDKAVQQAKHGMELVEHGVDIAMRGWSYMCLMRIMFSSGDLAGIEEVVHKVEQIARETHVPGWVVNQMTAWQARSWILQDNLEAASQWARERGLTSDLGYKLPSEFNYFSLFDYLILARMMKAEGRLEEATGLLQNLLASAEAGGRTARVIEILNLQALVMQARGETDKALHALGHAFQLAEPEGFFRIFVDEGPPMAHLLYEALTRGVAPGYAGRLLAAFPSQEREQADSVEIPAPGSELVEPLSEREIDVLEYIAMGLTNRDIAARLYLSQNTVKVHTRNIYSKLGVNSRTQAVARAMVLGILTSK
jgi:LuxR family maltose regulon positive regulatory protein